MAFVALLAYLTFVFIRPQEFVDPLLGLPLVKFSLIFAAMFMFTQKRRDFDAPQNWLLFLLIPLAIVSGLTNGWIGGGIDSAVSILTTIWLPFLVIQNLIDTLRKQQVVMLLLITASLIMVNDGIAQKASEEGIGWSGASLSQGTRITYLGIFNDPNDLGMFFVMVLPCVMYFLRKSNLVFKPMFVVALGYILYGIYLTNSRGALLGTMGLLGLWFLLRFGLKKSVVLGMFALPAVFIVMSKFREIDAEEASAAGRIDAWYEGIQLLLWKPFFGVGHGGFTDHHFLTAHNSFVLVFSELGITGYFLWISFLVISAAMILMIWNRKTPGHFVDEAPEGEIEIARLFTFSLLGYLITCFFLSRAYTPMLYVFCAMFVATFYRARLVLPAKKVVRLNDFIKYIWWVLFGSLFGIYLIVKLFV